MAGMRFRIAVLGFVLGLPWMEAPGNRVLAAMPPSRVQHAAAARAGQATPRLDPAALALAFEPNRGQTDKAVRFLAHGPGYTLFLTSEGAIMSLVRQPSSRLDAGERLPSGAAGGKRAIIRLIPDGVSRRERITVSDPLPGRVSYILGNRPSGWHTNIPTYGRLTYRNVYPAIDLVFHGQAGAPEYDWLVHPGGNPAQIRLRVVGAQRLTLTRNGELSMSTRVGRLVQGVPRLLQRGRVISGGFRLIGRYVVGVRVARFDRGVPLIIDPPIKLAYSTYLGGSNEEDANKVAVDNAGNAYLAGGTYSTDYPVCGSYPKCTAPGTAIQPTNSGSLDVIVSKLNASGTQLLYSTYLGGVGFDDAEGVAVDAAGDAYLGGFTSSNDFPVCGTHVRCGAPNTALQSSYAGNDDGFVFKLDPTGTGLLYSTYLGGSGLDAVRDLAIDTAGNAFVTGFTFSADFPVCGTYPRCAAPGTALQSSYGGKDDGFVSKLNAAGTQLLYSTYLGGKDGDFARGIAVDGAGNAYVEGETQSNDFPVCGASPKCAAPATAIQPSLAGGRDVFVSKLNATGTLLIYSTYLGGGYDDFGGDVAVDTAGNASITGLTLSPNFPVCGNDPKCVARGTAVQRSYAGGHDLGDAFVSKLNATGTQLVFSTYLGGTGSDHGTGVAVDSEGNVYVAGWTTSTDFPVCGDYPRCTTPGNAVQSGSGGRLDAFISALNPSGTELRFSTYLGGPSDDVANDVALDSVGNTYVVGETYQGFPTCPGADPRCASPGTALQPAPGGGIGPDAFLTTLATGTAQVPITITVTPRLISCTTSFSCTRVVATFTASSGAPCSAFATAIDWGDGGTTAGAIGGSTSAAGCTITGTHTYVTPGAYTVTIQVIGPAAYVSATTTATVSSFVPPTTASTPFTTIVAGNSAGACADSANLVIGLGVYVGATGGFNGTFSFQDLSRGIKFSTADGFRILSVLRVGNGPSNASGNKAVIFASVVQGGVTVLVRIDLADGSLRGCAVPNPRDTFRLQTSAGYDSGQVQIAQVSITTP